MEGVPPYCFTLELTTKRYFSFVRSGAPAKKYEILIINSLYCICILLNFGTEQKRKKIINLFKETEARNSLRGHKG